MSEEIIPEPIKQFENFTKTYFIPVEYTDSPANTEYEDVLFSRFVDVDLNTPILSTNVEVTKSIVAHDFGTEEAPEVRDGFKFDIIGFFGEELATNDQYVYRRGNDIIDATSFGELPDFNEPDTYIIKFFPDSRHSVNVSFEFTTNTTPANTFIIDEQEFELVPDRHVTRLLEIGETIQVRAAAETAVQRDKILEDINNLVPDYPGKPR